MSVTFRTLHLQLCDIVLNPLPLGKADFLLLHKILLTVKAFDVLCKYDDHSHHCMTNKPFDNHIATNKGGKQNNGIAGSNY
jgi:hypothetical protein